MGIMRVDFFYSISMKKIDITKLEKYKSAYLTWYPDAEEDIDVVTRKERGESIVELSLRFHRSKSTLYRTCHRVLSFLEDPTENPKHRYLQLIDSSVVIPIGLLAASLSCISEPAYSIFILSVSIHLAGLPDKIPHWLLKKEYPSLARVKNALRVIDEMNNLVSYVGRHQFRVYSSVWYDRGICYTFSATAVLLMKDLPSLPE